MFLDQHTMLISEVSLGEFFMVVEQQHINRVSSTPKLDINYRIMMLFQRWSNSTVTILGVLRGFVHVSFT